MHLSALLITLSVLSPVKTWFAPSEPVLINVNPASPSRLVLTDFNGNVFQPAQSPEVSEQKTVDFTRIFPQLSNGGYGVLYVVPKEKKLPEFLGTPLVVEAILDQGGKPGPIVIKVQPLQFAVMHTKAGPLTMIFYYDAAHHTVDSFLRLAEEGFYDKLLFHRIVPGFVIQGGDPRGDGSGGPGYLLPAEFNDKPHLQGVLSMARLGDPNEKYGAAPRCEFANSAGSQFFICLDYNRTKSLDHKYTAFGRVVAGMDAVNKIAATPLADEATGAPKEPQVIEKVEVKPVTAAENPYAELLHPPEPAAPAPAK